METNERISVLERMLSELSSKLDETIADTRLAIAELRNEADAMRLRKDTYIVHIEVDDDGYEVLITPKRG